MQKKIHKDKKPSWVQALFSALAAFFGVQTNSNRETDFGQASPVRFIAAGLIACLALILILLMIVKLVLQ